jgi:hypothetical protein
MDDPTKWNLGVAKLSGFMKHVRAPYGEAEVGDFHGIVAMLEEATGADLSHFKIPAGKMERQVIGARRASYSGHPGGVLYSSEKSCDSGFFRAQLEGLVSYLPALEGAKDALRPNRYDSLNDNELKELLFDRGLKPNRGAERGLFDRTYAIAVLLKSDRPQQPQPPVSNVFNIHDSNFIHSSSGSTITQNIGVKDEELGKIIAQLREFSAKPGLSDEDRTQLGIDIGTLELHANAQKPNKGIIKASLESAEAILEHAAGHVLGITAIAMIQHYTGINLTSF